MISARKTLGPELEDLDRQKKQMAELAKKNRSSLLAEIVFKQREEEERGLEEGDLKKRSRQKRAHKTIAKTELDLATREIVERLERERANRIQQELARRGRRRQPAGQPPLLGTVAQRDLEHTPFEQQRRTDTNVHVRFARSIAQVSYS